MQRLPEAFTQVSILDSREWKTYGEIARLVERNADHWFRQASPARLK